MKSLLTLLENVILDCGDECAIDTSLDIKSVKTRFGGEGINFLVDALPILAKGLERALDRGCAAPDLFPGFRCRQNLPILFGGFFELIFERTSGVVLDMPSISAIVSLRQISLMFKKIELESSPAAKQAALDAYVECDSEVGEWEIGASNEALIRFHQMGSLLFSRVFLEVDRKVANWELSPRHGSGATADRIVGNYKYDWTEYTERLEAVMPFWRYATTRGYDSSRYDRVLFREPGEERPAKVVLVPKTKETPRVIAEEPTCMQHAQQGIMLALKDAIDSSFLGSIIGTTYQEPNQLLALRGSIDGSLATLDLKEASDRVSNLLVMTLTANTPHLHDAVQASRSLSADVTGHGVVGLHRFASMGSALCFPFETMVFLTAVMIGIEDAYHTRFTDLLQIKEFVGSVRIYGDDIIVPVETVEHVIAALELFGFKVNADKSFWTGKFRESCGKEYFEGQDVTLAKVRRPFPTSRAHVTEIISLVALRNDLHRRLFWRASRWIDDYLSGMIPFPAVDETSPVLGAHSPFTGLPERKQMHPAYQIPVVGGMVPRYRRRLTPIDGDAALLKTLSGDYSADPITGRWLEQMPYGAWNQVITDVDHLKYSGRPEAVALNFRKARDR